MMPSIYENIKHIVTQLLSFFNVAELKTPANGRPKKISDRDALAFALYQHASTRATKKSVYDDFRETLACSYKTFVVSVNRVAVLTLRMLSLIMRQNKRKSHLMLWEDTEFRSDKSTHFVV